MQARRAERIRAFLGAKILFNNRSTTLDCQVRNISAGGAKLIVSPTVSVPEEFDLEIPQKGKTVRCRLRWRINDAAGVEFMDQTPATQVRADSLADRIRELEEENAALNRRIQQLCNRLALAEGAEPST
jgi:PilZ domain